MYLLAILGGGIHGSMLFANLPPKIRSRTLVIDNFKKPLQRFVDQCTAVGVHYLRSPASHCLSANLNNLFLYTHQKKIPTTNNLKDPTSYFVGPYYTPRLDLFLEHSYSLLKKSNITSCWQQDVVKNLTWDFKKNIWNIHTDRSISSGLAPVSAQKVIFALGMDEPRVFFDDLENTQHVLHSQYVDPIALPHKKSTVTVIGGGMSGVQVALKLTRTHTVHIIASHTHNTHNKTLYAVNHFDSKPCYIGPKCMPDFLNTSDYNLRLKILDQNRYPGTINPLVELHYKKALQAGLVIPHITRVNHIIKNNVGGKINYTLTLANGKTHVSDFVICATGCNKTHIPHANLIHTLSQRYNLPSLKTSFKNPNNNFKEIPIISPHLEWVEKSHNNTPATHSVRNLYITGGLAELELGPAAKNIIGAHLAYRRLSKIWHTW